MGISIVSLQQHSQPLIKQPLIQKLALASDKLFICLASKVEEVTDVTAVDIDSFKGLNYNNQTIFKFSLDKLLGLLAFAK